MTQTTFVNLLRPLQEGHGPKIPRLNFFVQQGPVARAHCEFGCPRETVFSVSQMWAIFGQMRKLAIRREHLNQRVWCFVKLFEDVPPPLYSSNGLIMFP